jgi:hypothetical protein
LVVWLTLALLLLVGLPLFLCMPLCNDVTLYDLAARNVLDGGVHYRDVFDTNLPGMVWLHVLVRATLGWRWETLRLVDFGVVTACVLLLVRWLSRLGLTRSARIGIVVLLLAFYFSTSEWNHCQRDTWMLLPALAALCLRRQQVEDLCQRAPWQQVTWRAVGEGCCWGAAFWIKPFVAVPAVVCWLVSIALVGRSRLGERGVSTPCESADRALTRPARLDGLGLLAGGLLVALPGVLWLYLSGAWPYFWDVFLHWDREYVSHHFEWGNRLRLWLGSWAPWGLLHLLAIPVALQLLWRGLKGREENRRPARLLLAAFYLGWWLQVIFLQKGYQYVLVPLVLLAVTLTAHWVWLRRRSPFVRLGAVVFLLAALWQHPVGRWERLVCWGRCWREGSSADLRDRLNLTRGRFTPQYARLEQVAHYLRSQGVGDGEVLCSNSTTHLLYLDLNLRPAVPYAHFETVVALFPRHHELIREQVSRGGQHYVVSDLRSLLRLPTDAVAEQPGQPLALPPQFPPEWTKVYPWSEPVVFRQGPYLVHRVTGPPLRLVPEPANTVVATR